MPKRFVALAAAVVILVGLSACSATPLQYEYAVDVVSSGGGRSVEVTTLQQALDERGEGGWELVALNNTAALPDGTGGAIAVFKRATK